MMIDGIRLYLPRTAAQGIERRLTDYRPLDTHTGNGRIGKMRVYQNLDRITIQGSLPKYLRGENVSPLSRDTVREAVEKLETETGLDLTDAVVGAVEVGTSIILKKQPGEYLKLFGDPPVYGKNVYSKAGYIETVSYGTLTGSFQFTAYDKGREMRDKGQPIPELFKNNVIRLEYRIIKRRGIKAKFNRDLTAHDLYDYDTYHELEGMFIQAYKAIPKMGREVYINTAKPLTPSRLEQLQAEQWRQSHTGDYNAYIQAYDEAGLASEKNLKRIRAKARKRDHDYSMSDKNPLIAELDCFVYGYYRRVPKQAVSPDQKCKQK